MWPRPLTAIPDWTPQEQDSKRGAWAGCQHCLLPLNPSYHTVCHSTLVEEHYYVEKQLERRKWHPKANMNRADCSQGFLFPNDRIIIGAQT